MPKIFTGSLGWNNIRMAAQFVNQPIKADNNGILSNQILIWVWFGPAKKQIIH